MIHFIAYIVCEDDSTYKDISPFWRKGNKDDESR
jgi:hypothetical protein